VTNAISGTTALGGLHVLAHSNSAGVTALGAAATTLSTVNIVGKANCNVPLLVHVMQ
jgi:NAD(P) transhydrogenase